MRYCVTIENRSTRTTIDYHVNAKNEKNAKGVALAHLYFNGHLMPGDVYKVTAVTATVGGRWSERWLPEE